MQDNGPAILITIPTFTKHDETVHYQVQLQELKSGYSFVVNYRYSELKKLNESLETLKTPLPKFPTPNWWRNTNGDSTLIEDRRQLLDNYFRNLVSSKVARDSLIMKNFIMEAQKEHNKKQEKEQKEKHKLEKKESGEEQQQEQKTKKKIQSKYATPACQPVQSPIEDGRERSQSYEESQQSKPKSNPGSRKGSQLNMLTFGGTKIYRGILSNAKQ